MSVFKGNVCEMRNNMICIYHVSESVIFFGYSVQLLEEGRLSDSPCCICKAGFAMHTTERCHLHALRLLSTFRNIRRRSQRLRIRVVSVSFRCEFYLCHRPAAHGQALARACGCCSGRWLRIAQSLRARCCSSQIRQVSCTGNFRYLSWIDWSLNSV